MLIDQFRYIKIQPKAMDLSTRLWGINPTNSVDIPQSLLLRSFVLGCLTPFPDTEKRVENATRSEVFSTSFDMFGNVVKLVFECLIYLFNRSQINICIIKWELGKNRAPDGIRTHDPP